MDPNSIFITQSEVQKDNDLCGKITYTNIMETIPENKVEKQIDNWKNFYKSEWRWRFLRLSKDKFVVEISCMKNNSDVRTYYNKKGEWVERKVDNIYDNYVEKQYFCYTSS